MCIGKGKKAFRLSENMINNKKIEMRACGKSRTGSRGNYEELFQTACLEMEGDQGRAS